MFDKALPSFKRTWDKMLSLFLTAASPRIVSYYFVLFVLLPFDYYVLITHLPSEEWGCIYTKGCITAVITYKTVAC